MQVQGGQERGCSVTYNPSPEIAPLRDYSKQFDRPVVVVFAIERGGERFHISTYGETKRLCKLAGSFGDAIAQAVADGTIAAPEIDPPNPVPVASAWRRESHRYEGEEFCEHCNGTGAIRIERDGENDPGGAVPCSHCRAESEGDDA